MKKHTKELLGLAGEYWVASQLCSRGIYAQLTLGNRKSTDLLLESSESLLRLSVKSKQGASWPAVKGIYRKDEFIIFLDYKNKAEGENPEVYILDSKTWKTLVMAVASENPKISIDDNNILTYPDGWKGLNVKENMILNHRNKWEKILEKARTD